MKRNRFLLLLAILFTSIAHSQNLLPGFDKQECSNLLRVSSQMGDSAYSSVTPVAAGYRKIYRSPEVGLDNLWDLWMTSNDIPVVSIRGTTKTETSWMANIYGAMVPAKGTLQLSNEIRFPYQLALNPRAAIHVGWLVSMAFLSLDMMPKIDSLYKTGKKEIYITGHSQGGAIAYLLTAYLYNLQKQQLLPADIRFKTYCSAAPKPGNLYFAFEYEAMTQEGWAYNVVNSADWVPETLLSVQTANDFNTINPFIQVKGFIKTQPFIKRLAFNHAYKKLTKSSFKAQKSYQKYLGGYVAKFIKKHLPGFVEPGYAPTADYVRTGNTITLLADEDYYTKFSQSQEKLFVNHFHAPYLYLLDKLFVRTNGAARVSTNTLSL